MKKLQQTAALLLLTGLLACALVSCGTPSAGPGSSSEGTTENAEMTAEEVLACFDDETYSKQIYTAEMIATIGGKLVLEGEIQKIVHITDKRSPSDNLIWAYLYEFSAEADAIAFEENRRKFVATVENGSCVRFGRIVVFGSSPIIPTIGAK